MRPLYSLLCTAAAWPLGAESIATSDGFSNLAADDFIFSRVSDNTPIREPSELRVTDKVIKLQRGDARSLSSTYIEGVRRAGMVDRGIAVSRLTSASTPLYPASGGQVFLAQVGVGGQQFYAVIDTGSSDPWIVSAEFECVDQSSYQVVDRSQCYFGQGYYSSNSITYRPISNENFNITYGDGEFLNGDMALEQITFAGITVPQQKFAVVDYAAWSGDGVSSGLLGFAYGSITSAFAGTDPKQDVAGHNLPYDPLFVSMYKQGLIAPVFSMAINRDDSASGLLALGGIPAVAVGSAFYSVPIQPVRVNATDGSLLYEFYAAQTGGFAVAADATTQFNLFANVNPKKRTVMANLTSVIIDSGTSLCYVPDAVMTAVANAFAPPAQFDSDFAVWTVQCSATPPAFGVAMGGKVFYVNPSDMIIDLGGGTCISAVQPNYGGYTILGDAWMKSVLVVFDVGAQQMRFAAREFYDLAPAAPVAAAG